MRIVYMGTPDFAVNALEELHRGGHEVLCVVSQPDRPVGRHAELKATPVKEKAAELGIPVLQPEKATDPAFLDRIEALAPDVIVVAAYGKILRKRLLGIPKYGCINIHGSLLPRWRGAAPVQWAVIAGDRESGLTVMQMAEGMDTGDILLQERLELSPEETGGSLFERLKALSGPLILKALELLEKGELQPVRQEEALVTVAPMLTKELGELDFHGSSRETEQLIRGLTPWPGTSFTAGGKRLKLHQAVPADDTAVPEWAAGKPGSLFTQGNELFAVCGQGVLKLLEVQAEGKKRMKTADFLLGNRSLFENKRKVFRPAQNEQEARRADCGPDIRRTLVPERPKRSADQAGILNSE